MIFNIQWNKLFVIQITILYIAKWHCWRICCRYRKLKREHMAERGHVSVESESHAQYNVITLHLLELLQKNIWSQNWVKDNNVASKHNNIIYSIAH